VQNALRVEKRRADWRLGRWTAKGAVAAWLAVAPERIEVLAAVDGAPEAWLDGRPAPVSVSLSHRAGRALAAVSGLPVQVGCDLELVEARSGPFVREWMTADEQALLAGLSLHDHAVAANAMWAAKEAAAKVRREGLRLDVRRAGVELDARGGDWRPLVVHWDDGPVTGGWWTTAGEWFMTIAASPAPAAPSPLPSGA
jgi:4'-phosphopantetheinyl transferase